jgi:hypothetical protein
MVQRAQKALMDLWSSTAVLAVATLFSRLYLGFTYVAAAATTAVLNQMLFCARKGSTNV